MDTFFPKLIRFDATWRCNLNCRHCQTGMFRGPDHPADLTSLELHRFFDEAAALGTRAVGFLGGEPMLRPDLADLLEHLQSLRTQGHITTNGVLITDDRADMLMNRTSTSVTVSLDGADAASHDFIRGKTTFRRAVTGIETLLRIRDPSSRARVGISVVLHRKNIYQAELFPDFARKLGVEHLTIAAVHRVGNAIRNWDDLSLEDDELREAGVRIAARLADGPSVSDVQVNFFTPAFRAYLRSVRGIRVPFVPILDQASLFECYMQCDGRVFPSQKCSEMLPDVLIGAAKDLGITFRNNSIRDQSLAEIWEGEDFRRYRSLMLGHQYLRDYRTCSNCLFSRTSCLPTAGAWLAGEDVPQPICIDALEALGDEVSITRGAAVA